MGSAKVLGALPGRLWHDAFHTASQVIFYPILTAEVPSRTPKHLSCLVREQERKEKMGEDVYKYKLRGI